MLVDPKKVINGIFATVDRFSPRFLAEEPFFIVDSSSAVTSLPFQSVQSVDSTEGLFQFVDAVQTSSSTFSAPLSSAPAAGDAAARTNNEESKHNQENKEKVQLILSEALSRVHFLFCWFCRFFFAETQFVGF